MPGDVKIYTKTGDDGSTGLLGGQRVRKSDPRIDCYGLIDELNAMLGWCAAGSEREPVHAQLLAVQRELFVIGSQLAIADGVATPASVPHLEDSAIDRLEMEIDALSMRLPPLKNFILPGGSEPASRLHVA